MLPDSLLVHILSFIPIVDAIETGILSKRWLYLWTSLPSLLFRYCLSEHYFNTTADFVKFVRKALVLCNHSKLAKFEVDFAYSHPMLTFGLSSQRGTPRRSFGSNSTLQGVMPNGVVGWKWLKKLSIGHVKLSEDVIEKILEGTPVLESLELQSFYGISRLHVSSKASLKKLILDEFWDFISDDERQSGNEGGFEISAPGVNSLEILGCFGMKNFWLAEVSSLVEATLNFELESDADDQDDDYKRQQNILRALLQSLVHVKNLTLGPWVLQVLSIMDAKGVHSPLSMCRNLTLDTHIKKSVLPGIANLLGCSTHLETLVITVSPSACYHQEYLWDGRTQLFNFNEKHYWTTQKRTFLCLMMHLKTVKFAGFRWYHHHFSFVQFLLKNAMMRQKMVINMPREDRKPPKQLSRAAQKLLSFPRSSTDAVVMFN